MPKKSPKQFYFYALKGEKVASNRGAPKRRIKPATPPAEACSMALKMDFDIQRRRLPAAAAAKLAVEHLTEDGCKLPKNAARKLVAGDKTSKRAPAKAAKRAGRAAGHIGNARLVQDLGDNRTLYRVEPPLDGQRYVIASVARAGKSVEVMLFAATRDGNIKDYSELAGPYPSDSPERLWNAIGYSTKAPGLARGKSRQAKTSSAPQCRTTKGRFKRCR